MRMHLVMALAATFVLAGAALAQRQTLAVRGGITTFSAGETRDIFGNGRFSFGISPAPRQVNRFRVDTDVDFIFANRNGNKLALIPVTLGVTTNLTEATSQVVPFFAVRAGLAYADYSITRPSNQMRFSEKKLLPTANVEAGLMIQRNLMLSARYNLFQKADGFDFNGFTVQLTYNFLRF